MAYDQKVFVNKFKNKSIIKHSLSVFIVLSHYPRDCTTYIKKQKYLDKFD